MPQPVSVTLRQTKSPGPRLGMLRDIGLVDLDGVRC